jgi:hypothetical protein
MVVQRDRCPRRRRAFGSRERGAGWKASAPADTLSLWGVSDSRCSFPVVSAQNSLDKKKATRYELSGSFMEAVKYQVWESTTEETSALTVEAYSPGQAAFLAAAEMRPGPHDIEYIVSDSEKRSNVRLVVEYWHRVEPVSDPYSPPDSVADAS